MFWRNPDSLMLNLQFFSCFTLNTIRLSDTFIFFPFATDTYAMAGMALQCVKDSGFHMHNAAQHETALSNIKQKLLASRRADGHIGNEFSTGLAVQVGICFSSFVCFAE